MDILKMVILIINSPRILMAIVLINLCGKETKSVIIEESVYWRNTLNIKAGILSQRMLLGYILIRFPEYRNLVIHRMKNWKGKHIIYASLMHILFKPMDSLYLDTKSIGKNLFIQHGFATVVAASRIGEFCWINQQVTIGYSFASDPPVIGNGVRICAGANVIGSIEIGDNAIIGAGATVVHNVEKDSIVGGVPAYKLGENLEHKLFFNTSNDL